MLDILSNIIGGIVEDVDAAAREAGIKTKGISKKVLIMKPEVWSTEEDARIAAGENRVLMHSIKQIGRE